MNTMISSIALSLALAMPVFAQSTETPPTETKPATQEAVETAGVVAETQAEAPKEIKKIGGWTVNCTPDSCAGVQEVKLSDEEKAPVMRFFLEQREQLANLTVGTPLGVSIPGGVSVILSEQEQAPVWQADYASCVDTMCLASKPINADVLESNKNPILVLTLATGEVVGVPFVSEGAKEAIDLVKSENAKLVKTEAPAAESDVEKAVIPVAETEEEKPAEAPKE